MYNDLLTRKPNELNSHTQLFAIEKSWNLKETSPAVSRSSLTSGTSLISTLSSTTSGGRGSIWFSLGWRANWISGGNDMMGGETDLSLALPVHGVANARSHKKTWIRIGVLACRWSESFWLRETVSKQRIAPVEETIQGSTFWFDTLETTSNLDVLIASLYRSLSPDLVEGTFSFPSITDEM